MKNKRSFASRAKSIQNKYKNYKRSKLEEESMLDELQVLADEQEAVKAEMVKGRPQGRQAGGSQVSPNILAMGGLTDNYLNIFGDGGPTGTLSNEEIQKLLQEGVGKIDVGERVQAGITEKDYTGVTTRPDNITDEEWIALRNTEGVANSPIDTGEGAQLGADEYLDTSAMKKSNTLTKEEWKKIQKKTKADKKEGKFFNKVGNFAKENSESIAAVGGGLAPFIANVVNRRRLEDPDLINPTLARTSLKSSFYDPTGMEGILANNLASARNDLASKGGNTEDYVNALRQINQDNTTSQGLLQIEAQKLNNAEQARLDKAVTDVDIINSERLTQASIDQASRQDFVDKYKRDYRAAAGENVGNIFGDISDAMLAKKVAPILDKTQTIKNTRGGQ